jgi:predicted transcriptional regulator of viral defense system
MRSTLVYIWLLATILPTFSPWGTIAYYHINKDYITRVLCENRDKPELNCNGQCYLAKKLKAQEEQKDKETREFIQNLPFLQLFAGAVFTFDFLPASLNEHRKQSFTYHLASYLAPLSILVPPPCV